MAGFGFFIELKPTHDTRILDIRFEGGATVLRQTQTRIIAREELGAERRRVPCDLRSLSWMLGRGWLSPDQLEALQLLGQFGACRQRLEQPTLDDMTAIAHHLLQLHMQMEVAPQVLPELWDEHLPELRTYMHTEFPNVPPVIALWSPWTSCLNVIEGSHLDVRTVDGVSGIDYEFGDDTLLWLNLDTSFNAPTGGISSPLTAFVPQLASGEQSVPPSLGDVES